MKISFFILISLALFSFGCGRQTPSALEKVYGISGKNYCDELNQGFHNALKVHLVHNESESETLYTQALLQTLEHTYDTITQIKGETTSLEEDYSAMKKKLLPLNSETLADLRHLKDCSDLIQIGNFYVQQLNSRLIFARPELFWDFLSNFASHLDAVSHYDPPVEFIALKTKLPNQRIFLSYQQVEEVTGNIKINVLDNETLYVLYPKFSKESSQELKKKLTDQINELKTLDGSLKSQDVKIILDLRSNTGGSLMELRNIANFFFTNGEIGKLSGRENTEQDDFVLKIDEMSDHPFSENPLILLINNFSASASEMLSQMLQETGRAKIVGEKSFGKLVGQQVYEFEAFPSEKHLGGSLAITADYFYGPAGTSRQILGIEPDYKIKDPRWENLKRTRHGSETFPILNIKDFSRLGFSIIETGNKKREVKYPPSVYFDMEFSPDLDLQALAEEESVSAKDPDIVLSAAKILFRKSHIVRYR